MGAEGTPNTGTQNRALYCARAAATSAPPRDDANGPSNPLANERLTTIGQGLSPTANAERAARAASARC
eukprot:7099259-Alexandrium_andersonii.AAC.1